MSSVPDLDPGGVAELGAALERNIRRAVKVSDRVVRDLVVAFPTAARARTGRGAERHELGLA